MEYNLSKHNISYAHDFLDTVNEQIVDVDITLPDYCPDIEKILKCNLIPKIYSKKISGGQLSIEGISCIRVMYCDSIRHSIRCYEQTVPFTATFNLKSTPEQYVVLTDTKCEYINCRALSPRKLVVHGAFSLYAKVICKDYIELFSYEEDDDLQVKHKDYEVSDLCALCEEQFSVTEDVNVSSKPPVEALLSYEVTPRIIDVKSIHNKVVLNAELTLHAMYISDLEKCSVEHISYVFPINRIIDCENVSDNTLCVPVLSVMSYDLHIKNDTLSDGSTLTLDVKLNFCETGYHKKTVRLIEDCYSTKYHTNQKKRGVNCETNHRYETLSHIMKSSVNFDNMKISRILNIVDDSLTLTPVLSDNKLSFNGKTNICILLEDDENNIHYIERIVDVSFTPEVAFDYDRVLKNSCIINSISYRLIGDSEIELRLELRVGVVLSNAVSANPVVSVERNDDSEIASDDSSLVLYFAQKGESIWEVAKMYSTKEAVLMDENNLESSILESPMMLLVPTE